MKTKNDLSQDQLKEFLCYLPDTGEFVWRKDRSRSAKRGMNAGRMCKSGYMGVKILKRNYFLHRLAWLYVYGAWPREEIDHINGSRADNRIDNLRQATRAQNKQNIRKATRKTASGLLGAHKVGKWNKWRASITVGGKAIRIGYYETKEQAHAAYLDAKRSLHEFSTI